MSAQGSEAQRIVVGVDGSPPAQAALAWALGQAELTDGSVDAVIVWEYPPAIGGFGVGASMYEGANFRELAEKTVTEAVGSATAPAGSVSVRTQVIEGNPAQVLLAAADDADLLVVGSRGHGGFVGALLGSVSQHCVHHAHCPVVVVREGIQS
jgi:nucleotide-binding universal stress UspA family protein